MLLSRELLWGGLKDEIHGLVRGYYDSTPASDGLPPYDFRWEIYDAAQAQGALTIITARAGGSLMGFGLYLVTEHPHHRGFVVAECDTLAVSPSWRGRGVGRRIINRAVPTLKRQGAKRIIHRQRLIYGARPLFQDLGFRADETAYFKDL